MSSAIRRKDLLEHMKTLEAKGLNCLGCSGKCCTYEANSMMVTPLEAAELQDYLQKKDMLSEEFKHKCKEVVAQFRLNQSLGDGRRSYIRRTYTCPFFNHQELGCPLPREIKPYGCLAFNSHHQDLKAGEYCYSEKEALQRREGSLSEEKVLNERLRDKFHLSWEKSPLPLALLELWDVKLTDEDLTLD